MLFSGVDESESSGRAGGNPNGVHVGERDIIGVLSSAEKWPLIQDVSEELATLYNEIQWKPLPFSKEDGDENEDSKTCWRDAEKDDAWKSKTALPRGSSKSQRRSQRHEY